VWSQVRFLNSLQNVDPVRVGGKAVQETTRAWTIKDGSLALIRWARSRPTLSQKTSGLIGMAEALGHAGL